MTDARTTSAAPIDFSDQHAHGLARHDLRQLQARCGRASDGAFRKFNASEGISTAKGARRLVAKIARGYEGTAWAQRAHADRRGTYAGWLVPVVHDEDIAVCCVSLSVPAGGAAQLRQFPWLIVPKHAIARGHQRLHDADWLAVQSELREAALQSALVQLLSMSLGLRQFAIPALHGLLIGDVGENCLYGKTFIVPPYSRRWGAVLDGWLRFQQHLSREGNDAIEAIALDHEMPALAETAEALGEEFERFRFLRDAYIRGNDHIGDLWEAARGQAE